jgi:hypothetical protein
MNDYLQHHGILGMKWGVRRYQNADGSLTEAGKRRYVGEKHQLKSTSQLEKDFAHLNDDPIIVKTDKGDYVEPSDESIQAFQKFDRMVRDKCGDWYNSEWKTERLKKIGEDRTKELDELRNSDPNRAARIYRDSIMQEAYDKAYESVVSKPFGFLNKKFAKQYADAAQVVTMLSDKKLKELEAIADRTMPDYYKKERAIRDKYDNKMLGEILGELGYENTPAAREYIRQAVMWD